MRGPGTWWRGKSTPAKVETYTRWSFHFFAVIEIMAVGLPVTGELGLALGAWLMLLVCAHAAVCALTVSRALDWVRGRREQPVRLLWALGAVTLAVAVTALVVAEHGPDGDGVDSAAGGVFGVVLIFGAGIIALGVRNRRRVYAVVAGFAAGAGLVAFPLGQPAPAALVSALAVLLGGGFLAFSAIFSVWLLNAVYELDEARETRARLAVAEERLRFGRDLHDVMGRNLAVIALKSELAVQLARRERPEAVEQMIEVQRIAQESQREVRDVVRGYREADLGVELAGAQGVLTAAGIECEVTGEAAGLPAEVQSALAWVVREATTNVLRHGDAGRCVVGVRVTEGRVVLTVENDGTAGETVENDGAAGASDGGGGSGLAGLRERLAAVDGTLEAGRVGEGMFRLVAEVPLAGAGVREVAV
ncbi:MULTISPECIES: histidine kinase [unclassified Streptomyces]|uniref:sensor histidine kinase n=1 Tax=unclassified Streptomyces TaxID=2593676 RepID=UPI0023665564|nr:MULTISPECIES: histidine kinase [unclassified Streptomyces]MDF3141399.1 histidine kinase [Streptomyces sp. T21Q-yed]WDF39430.1 histidine kinase [Streptomyces sp. T12]